MIVFLTEEQAKLLLKGKDAEELIYGFNNAIRDNIKAGKLATIRQEKVPKKEVTDE